MHLSSLLGDHNANVRFGSKADIDLTLSWTLRPSGRRINPISQRPVDDAMAQASLEPHFFKALQGRRALRDRPTALSDIVGSFVNGQDLTGEPRCECSLHPIIAVGQEYIAD